MPKKIKFQEAAWVKELEIKPFPSLHYFLQQRGLASPPGTAQSHRCLGTRRSTSSSAGMAFTLLPSWHRGSTLFLAVLSHSAVCFLFVVTLRSSSQGSSTTDQMTKQTPYTAPTWRTELQLHTWAHFPAPYLKRSHLPPPTSSDLNSNCLK